VIADGDPVSISAQVLKDTLDAIEGLLAIDDPLLVVEVFSEGFEVSRIFEMTEAVGKDKIIGLEASFEKVQGLAFEQRRHDPDRDEKTFATWDPAASVGGESAPGDNTMNVGMVHEVLTPSMENTDHAYGCTEMFWVLGELGEGLGGRAEKQIVQEPLIQESQVIQLWGKGKDDMEVLNGQKILTASLDPFFFS
jgi:hypothetical protein